MYLPVVDSRSKIWHTFSNIQKKRDFSFSKNEKSKENFLSKEMDTLISLLNKTRTPNRSNIKSGDASQGEINTYCLATYLPPSVTFRWVTTTRVRSEVSSDPVEGGGHGEWMGRWFFLHALLTQVQTKCEPLPINFRTLKK